MISLKTGFRVFHKYSTISIVNILNSTGLYITDYISWGLWSSGIVVVEGGGIIYIIPYLNLLSLYLIVVCTCQTLDTTGGMEVTGNAQLEILPLDSVESGIKSALGAFRERLHDLCKGSLADIFKAGENLFNVAHLFLENITLVLLSVLIK